MQKKFFIRKFVKLAKRIFFEKEKQIAAHNYFKSKQTEKLLTTSFIKLKLNNKNEKALKFRKLKRMRFYFTKFKLLFTQRK